MTALDWAPAPDGQVLMAGYCLARDEDGQGCAHGFVHLSAHQSTGLRARLESDKRGALIRAYDAATADRLEAMEEPLFAHFGFAPVARQDLVRTKSGGIHAGWAIIVGPFFAPTEKVSIRLRLVCYVRGSAT
jgi:hypothetical protein